VEVVAKLFASYRKHIPHKAFLSKTVLCSAQAVSSKQSAFRLRILAESRKLTADG
jgi:hypothetical protein